MNSQVESKRATTIDNSGPVGYHDYGPDRRVVIRRETDGEIVVPFLSWHRGEDGVLSLTLDHRFGLDIPAGVAQDSIVEFIANAIAVGAGYPSIYYTDRKMAFR